MNEILRKSINLKTYKSIIRVTDLFNPFDAIVDTNICYLKRPTVGWFEVCMCLGGGGVPSPQVVSLILPYIYM